MKKYLFFPLLIMLLMPVLRGFGAWEKTFQPPGYDSLTALKIHPANPPRWFAASRHTVFEKLPDGAWKSLWHLHGSGSEINRIYSFREWPDYLFVLTRKGAFAFNLNSQAARQIHRGRDAREKSALSFAVLPDDPDHWFLGTEDGLFESDNAGQTWFRFSRFSTREPVPVIFFSGNRLFIATASRLYSSDDLTSFRLVFSMLAGELPPVQDADPSETPPGVPDGAESDIPAIHELLSSDDLCGKLWLATRKGVLESRDCGGRWAHLSRSGLQDEEIRYLAYSRKYGKLFAGTGDGVYKYDFQKSRWEQIFEGLAHPTPRALDIFDDEKGWLAAITQDGFVQYPLTEENSHPGIFLPSPDRLQLFHELARLEPGAVEVQRAVVRYGHLSHWKIKRWHSQSRLRSLVPALSFSRDFTRRNNIDLDRGGTLDPDKFIAGPEDLTEGWDMRVSWDLGDFIWSSSQTSIDSRDKLMVELRNDLLSEATRIYYERRRLQLEAVFSPAGSEKEHLERLLRIDELTSLLDGMTNGYFSKELRRIYLEHSRLNQLWDYRA